MESMVRFSNCLFYIFLLLVFTSLQIIAIDGPTKSILKKTVVNLADIDFPDFDATEPSNLQNYTDHHEYYNSTFYNFKDVADSFWIDLDKFPKTVTHRMLSESHRRAAAVQLSFEFPFYGQILNNITIATGGFLYTGEHIHSWIAATQYIAPLMANFDPGVSNSSSIKYLDNGTSFTVLWDNVILRERASEVGGGGAFKFETTLYQNGDIAFVYKNIPFPIAEISNESHPVKIGISDAYVLERTTYFFRKKIIYEYHKTDLRNYEIGNDTVIYLKALPTCLQFKDCATCESVEIRFNCTWCESNKKCSDGMDRNRQEWLQLNCISHKNKSACPKGIETTQSTDVMIETTNSKNVSTPAVTTKMPVVPIVVSSSESSQAQSSSFHITPTEANKPPTSIPVTSSPTSLPSTVPPAVYGGMKASSKVSVETKETGLGAGGVFAIILVIVLILGIGIWIFYAYNHPQSSSGQFLIKYRPTRWHWWKGEESGYSASVHM